MKITIAFDMSNAAFDGDEPERELARLLRKFADRVESTGNLQQQLLDKTGNTVGQSEVSS
jgi:hypothetical protein